MALIVKKAVNQTDAELDIIDNEQQPVVRVPKHSSKPVPKENLLNLTFVSKTGRPVCIKIRPVIGDDNNGDTGVEVKAGHPEEEELPN